MSKGFRNLYDRSQSEGLPLSPKALAFRQAGWNHFLSVGLPQRTHEEWKYTSLRSLNDLLFEPAAALVTLDKKATESVLSLHKKKDDLLFVFMNGTWSAPLSDLKDLPQSITVTPIAEAMSDRQDFPFETFVQAGSTLRNPHGVHAFGALNDAFLRDGLVLDVAPKAIINRTLHLLHIVTPDALEHPAAFFPRHIIRLGAGAEVEMVETFCTISVGEGQREAEPYLVSPLSEIILDQGARLSHLRVIAEGVTGSHLGIVRAQVRRDAYLGTFSFVAGARLARLDLDVTLADRGAEVDLDGLYLGKGTQHIDHHTVVEHKVPQATSRQLYKGILGDSSRGVFNGKILVREGSHGTNAFQLNQNLLLSSDAEIDTKPELQIDADDVKCSHGAAIGQLDANQLFYLQSRGLNKSDAEKLLCAAFADDVLLKVKTKGRFDYLKRLTTDYVI